MKTAFLLLAQYDGLAVIPLDRVCADYFSHLTPEKMKMKVATGEIHLPLIRLEASQKAARGVHFQDLADYLDKQRQEAQDEIARLTRPTLVGQPPDKPDGLAFEIPCSQDEIAELNVLHIPDLAKLLSRSESSIRSGIQCAADWLAKGFRMGNRHCWLQKDVREFMARVGASQKAKPKRGPKRRPPP
jgi:hypothetical protein